MHFSFCAPFPIDSNTQPGHAAGYRSLRDICPRTDHHACEHFQMHSVAEECLLTSMYITIFTFAFFIS
jgi:hypothetical protein